MSVELRLAGTAEPSRVARPKAVVLTCNNQCLGIFAAWWWGISACRARTSCGGNAHTVYDGSPQIHIEYGRSLSPGFHSRLIHR